MNEKMTPEEIIEKINIHDDEAKKLRNALIEEHFSFIVHAISKVTGRYVEIENSEELSIGLLAFNEAIERYEPSKGASFLTYAHLVISSRVKDHFRKNSSQDEFVSFDDVSEEGIHQMTDVHMDDKNDIAKEIEEWESILLKFGFDLERLADETPRHVDTRNNAIGLSEDISGQEDIVGKMYEKYRLPIAMIVLRFQTTKKVVKHSKIFIIATVVILTKKFDLIRSWIYRGQKGYMS